MKIILFISLFTVLTIGCKKDEPAVQSTPVDTVEYRKPPEPSPEAMIPPHAKAAVSLSDVNLLKTHSSAARSYLNLPDSALPMPMPPGSRPFKNLKLRDSSQVTVFYNFTTAQGRPGEMVLTRIPYQSDSIWIPVHILPR